MPMVTVKFEDVGRGKKTWEAKIPQSNAGELNGDAMIDSIERSRALMSRDIDVYVTSDEPLAGSISAGFHTVGRWRLVPSIPAGGAR